MLARQLTHLKQEYHEVGSLAITVPANFLNKARQQTIQAALDAGFPSPIRVIDEPTAAALYYVHTSPVPMEGTYLVYDFGGGTLDVSIMEVSGRDIQVKMSHGVARLGGMDLDKVAYDLIQQKLSEFKECFTAIRIGKVQTHGARRSYQMDIESKCP